MFFEIEKICKLKVKIEEFGFFGEKNFGKIKVLMFVRMCLKRKNKK